MPTCVAINCTNSNKKVNKIKDGVSFFRLPAELNRREIWSRLIRVQREDPFFKVSTYHRLCSAHFNESDFTMTKSGIRKLKDTAVPHLPIPEKRHYNFKVDKNRIQSTSNWHHPVEVETNDNEKPSNLNNQEDTKDADFSYLESVFNTPRTSHLKKEINRLQSRNLLYIKKIRALQKQNTRLKQKNNALVKLNKKLCSET